MILWMKYLSMKNSYNKVSNDFDEIQNKNAITGFEP